MPTPELKSSKPRGFGDFVMIESVSESVSRTFLYKIYTDR